MESLIKCDNCGCTESTTMYDLENPRFIPGPIVKCNGCGLIYRSVSLSEDELAHYYQREEYGEDSYLKEYGKDYLRHLPQSELNVYYDVLDLLEEQAPAKGRLLEVGCAGGVLLDMARKRGWEVMGVEVSPSMAESARKNFNIEVVTGTIESASLPGQQFDAIVLWDVIEHFLSPAKVVKRVNGLLKKNGIAVLFTQDNDSFLVWLGNRFAQIGVRNFLYHLFDNFHLSFYNVRTLTDLLERHSCRVVKIKHYPAEISKRGWSDISFGIIIQLGTKLATVIARILRKQYRMVFLAKKEEQ